MIDKFHTLTFQRIFDTQILPNNTLTLSNYTRFSVSRIDRHFLVSEEKKYDSKFFEVFEINKNLNQQQYPLSKEKHPDPQEHRKRQCR